MGLFPSSFFFLYCKQFLSDPPFGTATNNEILIQKRREVKSIVYKFGYHYYIPRLVIIGQSELLPSCCLSCGLDILFHSNNNNITGHSNLAAALIDTHSHTLAVRQRERGSLPFVSFPVSWLQAIFPNAFKELSLSWRWLGGKKKKKKCVHTESTARRRDLGNFFCLSQQIIK